MIVFLAAKASRWVPPQNVYIVCYGNLVPEFFKPNRRIHFPFRPQERRAFSASCNRWHSILAYIPTAIPQQSGDPPIAVAPVFAGQRHDLSCQRIFVGSVEHFVASCPSPLPQQPAGMPLRYLIALACMPDRATPPLRA